MKKFCVYGNPTIDVIELETSEKYVAYGGGAYYSSLPLLEAREEVSIYSVYSPLLVKHPVSRFLVKKQYSPRANIFILEYKHGTRRIKVLDVAPPLYPWNVQEEECYAIVNPVLGEVGVGILKELSCRSPAVAMDVQGFLREVIKGYIEIRPSAEALLAISMVEVVHLDIEELCALMGYTEIKEALSKLSRYVKRVAVVTVRPNHAFIVTQHGYKSVSFENTPIVKDKTGSGDYYLSSYFYNYILHGDEVEAAYKAHERTSAWLARRGKQTPIANCGLN
ncbi:MAG: sugar kinase [Desulfurococcaceae archaeon]